MTLIVGNKLNKSIFIESDSMVTLPNEEKSYPLDGVLKICILHPLVCVAFAGTIDYAREGLKELINFFRDKNTSSIPLNDQDIKEALAILLTKQKESKGTTDFALASLHEGEPKLFKIQNEKIEYDINNFWLGSKEGFEVYQKHFHNRQEDKKLLETYTNCPEIIDPKASILKQQMYLSFKKVIERNIKGVGDFQISVETDHRICLESPVFLYGLKSEIIVSEPQTLELKAGERKPLALGTAQGGSCGISYFRSVSFCNHGIAIHYLHSDFGVLFCPQINSLNGIKIKGVNSKEFAGRIKKEYNIPLQGVIRMSDTAIQFIDTSRV